MSARILFVALAVGCTTYVVPDAGDLAARAVSPCVEGAIVDWVNGADADALKAGGVHSRAADSLAATRAGDDGLLGTDDDVVFTTLAQIDAVPQVGPSALDALEAHVEPQCTADPVAACISEASLAFANEADAEQLKAAGVYATGANNLVDARPLSDMEAVDAVSGIGPSSLAAIDRWAEGSCRAQAIFSPQPYYDSHLARSAAEIDAATRSLDIAMYSFRDGGVLEAVLDAAERGVSVRALLDGASDDRNDLPGSLSADLEDAGIEVRWVNKVMHHKFAIVDGVRTDLSQASEGLLMTGSGNWSYSAGTKYDEDTLFLRDERLLLAFQQEFEHLWTNGRLIEWNEAIEPVVGLTITDDDIAAVDGADAWFTSDNFRTYTSSAYGPTFARQGHLSNVQDELAALIGTADESILIASGHLRSRPIAEAVLAAHEANPDLDIRVYLDGQEYTSAWYSDQGVLETEACLAEAVDDDDREDCLEDGIYWGYQLHAAGVDVRFKLSAYRWDYRYAEQMHHKLVIVDGDTVATGSYNYSPNAEFDTFENVVVLERDRYAAVVDDYVARYDELWETRRDLYEPMIDELLYGTGDVSIVFDGMALTWDQVDELKWLIGEVCPEVDSDPYREDPSAHRTCER
jgi:phosphatidylserine/phosphatidylglycerophosphate/cardiolipin synthase-like enzyme